MPSPIGHALAGIATAWLADLIPGNRTWRTAPAAAAWHERAGDGLTLLCAGLGAAPDLDLTFIAHRTVTHSVGAACFVGLAAAGIAAGTRRPIARIALMCAAAYGSHLLLDWLSVDRFPPLGIELMWPLNHEWYISGLDLFRQTERFHVLTRGAMIANSKAIAQEVAILGPIVAALWSVRVKALAGLATQVARGDQAPQ